jgi:hypothetical protein
MTIIANGSAEGTTEITLRGTSGEFFDTDTFIVKVYDPSNYTIEDFETADFEYLNWEFSGDAGWIIDNTVIFEGEFSSRSSAITHNQKAEMLITADFDLGGKIKFNSKVSSEANYDFLKFYIDRYEKNKFSGQTGWVLSEFSVGPGTYTFKWSYQKDGSSSTGSDCAWVDYITLEGGRMTGIETVIVPTETDLFQNYPNPFNPNTSIRFALSDNGNVRLSVFNQKGELVNRLYEGKLEKGLHRYDFDGSGLTSGIYFYKLETENNSSMKKMILLK